MIGAAFATIISSLVNDIIMPPIGMALGGVDYAAESAAPAGRFGASAPIEAGAADGKRSAAAASFSAIPESGREARAVADLFAETFDVEAFVQAVRSLSGAAPVALPAYDRRRHDPVPGAVPDTHKEI